MSETKCYTCKVNPAGNEYAGPYSAYCESCQPRDSRRSPTGNSQCGCGNCGELFATLTDFDNHQVHLAGGSDSVFTGECRRPDDIGLIMSASGVWGTPEGTAARAAFAARARNRPKTP